MTPACHLTQRAWHGMNRSRAKSSPWSHPYYDNASSRAIDGDYISRSSTIHPPCSIRRSVRFIPPVGVGLITAAASCINCGAVDHLSIRRSVSRTVTRRLSVPQPSLRLHFREGTATSISSARSRKRNVSSSGRPWQSAVRRCACAGGLRIEKWFAMRGRRPRHRAGLDVANLQAAPAPLEARNQGNLVDRYPTTPPWTGLYHRHAASDD